MQNNYVFPDVRLWDDREAFVNWIGLFVKRDLSGETKKTARCLKLGNPLCGVWTNNTVCKWTRFNAKTLSLGKIANQRSLSYIMQSYWTLYGVTEHNMELSNIKLSCRTLSAAKQSGNSFTENDEF